MRAFINPLFEILSEFLVSPEVLIVRVEKCGKVAVVTRVELEMQGVGNYVEGLQIDPDTVISYAQQLLGSTEALCELRRFGSTLIKINTKQPWHEGSVVTIIKAASISLEDFQSRLAAEPTTQIHAGEHTIKVGASGAGDDGDS